MNYFLLKDNRITLFTYHEVLNIADVNEEGYVVAGKTEDVVSCEDVNFLTVIPTWYHAKNIGVHKNGLLAEDSIVVSCKEKNSLFVIPKTYINIPPQDGAVLEVRLLRDSLVHLMPIGVAYVTCAFGFWTKELFEHEKNIYARIIEFYA